MRYNAFANSNESPSLEPLKSKLTTTDLERTAKCYEDFNFKLSSTTQLSKIKFMCLIKPRREGETDTRLAPKAKQPLEWML